MKRFLRDVVTAAYDLHASERDWCAHLVEIAGAEVDLGMGASIAIAEIDGRNYPKFLQREYHSVPYTDPASRHAKWVDELTPEQRLAIFGDGRWVQTFRERWELGQEHELGDVPSEVNVHDVLCMAAVREGRGVFLNAIKHEDVVLRSRDKNLWRKASHHIAPAFHIRDFLNNLDGVRNRHRSLAALVFEARDTVQGLETEATLEKTVWDGILDGKWSLFDIKSDRPGHWSIVAHESHGKDPRALTQRERAVLEFVVEGASNKEIAFRLGMSASTVAVHVNNILNKFKSRNRVELICIGSALLSTPGPTGISTTDVRGAAERLHDMLDRVLFQVESASELRTARDEINVLLTRLESIEES